MRPFFVLGVVGQFEHLTGGTTPVSRRIGDGLPPLLFFLTKDFATTVEKRDQGATAAMHSPVAAPQGPRALTAGVARPRPSPCALYHVRRAARRRQFV